MEKIIVEIKISATGETIDFAIPSESFVHDTVCQIAEIILAMGKGASFDMDTIQLCDLDTHAVLRDELTLLEAGVRDGSRLLLV
jgi:hypothetical protein